MKRCDKYRSIFPAFLASCELWHLLRTFANSLDSDQDRQNVDPDMKNKLFDTLKGFLEDFFEKVDFEKMSAEENYPACEELLSCQPKVTVT